VFLARSALLAPKGRPAHKVFRGPSASRARRVLPAQPGHRGLRALRQRLPAQSVLLVPQDQLARQAQPVQLVLPERRELRERTAPPDQLVLPGHKGLRALRQRLPAQPVLLVP
jgi:hypothetical protein